MKSNELRIGNLITDRSGVVISVSSIHLDNTIRVFENGETHGCYETSIFNPIPLTEEWLLKFGFLKMDEKHNFFILGYEVNFKIDKNIKRVAWCNNVLTNVGIKYVHQLQNLYFALTATELTVKNK